MAFIQRQGLRAVEYVRYKAFSRRFLSGPADILDLEGVRQQMEMDRQFVQLPESKQVLGRLVTSVPTQRVALSSMHDAITQLIGAYPPAGLRVMSSLLTFPLTLAFLLQHLLVLHKTDLRIAIIGARAEASLPSPWWRAALFSLEKVQHLHLTMVGPAQPTTSPTTTTHTWGDKSVSITSGSHRNLLHRDPDCASLLDSSDAFATFHPGLGHAAMQPLWQPTLDLLLHSRRPVLGSAYSATDMEADLRALDGRVEWLLEPVEGAFAGPTIAAADGQQTTNNAFLYAFRGRGAALDS